MNLRHLRYFIRVAEVGSITKAATSLNMTQPALSRQIRAFEHDLGWSLFERGARSIQLSYAGEVVLKEGNAIMQQVDQGVLRMKRAIDGGVIRIGYAPSLGGALLKQAISCFNQRHPQVSIQLFDHSSQEMRKGILDGKLELMLEVPTSEKEFEWEDLIELPKSLAIPKNHPLLKKLKSKRLHISELEGEPFLLLSRFEYPSYWDSVSKYFMKHGVNVKVAGEFDGIDSLAVGLEAGLGIAFVSERSKLDPSIQKVQLAPPVPPVCVGVGWNASRPLDAITQEFIQELKQAAH